MAVYTDERRLAEKRGTEASRRESGSRANVDRSLSKFDPRSYLADSARAAYDTLAEDLGHRRTARAANLNSRGLFKSDLGGAEENRGFQSRLANALAGLSMQAGGLEMDRMGLQSNLYNMDRDDRRFYDDMRVGLGVSEAQQRLENKKSKHGMWGNILGGIAGAAGTILGGPIGGALAGGFTKKLVG